MKNTSWELPNPFIREDGTQLLRPEDWQAQREYLAGILAEDLYGQMPPAPGNTEAELVFSKPLWEGCGVFEVYDLRFGPGHAVHEKTALIRAAASGDKPIPIVLCGGFVDEAIAKKAVARGFCIATPLTDEAAPDLPEYREGTLYRAYPEYRFKVIAMWAWLLSRVVDWLYTLETVDCERLVVAGHSRFGKAALCCAVYDERVRACVAAGSGCGGMGSLRVAGGRWGENSGKVETLGGMITGMFPQWFREELAAYGAKEQSAHARENELRFDSNFIGSAIAPRPLLVLEGLDDTWANPFGTMAAWSAVSEVYHFLGKDSELGIHFREGGHALNAEDWAVLLDFCASRLRGETPQSVWHTRGEAEPSLRRSWSAPRSLSDAPAPAKGSFFTLTPERIRSFRESLRGKWAFAEAGLETGMDRFVKQILAEAGADEELSEQADGQ